MIGWATQALFASALLMVGVLALRRGLARVFGARVAYALWALPALRLILPPLPAWHTAAPFARAGATFVVFGDAPMPVAPGLSLVAILWIVWAVGAAAFLAWHLVAYTRFRRALLIDAVALETIDGVRVIASPAATGPLALGVYDRIVALPTDDRYDADERGLALAHERMHHARGDLHANWVALVVLAIHWFDPLAWIAYRAFRADQERACDADVLARQGRGVAHAYARAIVKAAQGRAVSPVCHLHTVTDLKGRLKMLKLFPLSRRRLHFGGVSVAALVLAGLGATASTGTAQVADNAPRIPATRPPAALPVPSTPSGAVDTVTTSVEGHAIRTIMVYPLGNGQTDSSRLADVTQGACTMGKNGVGSRHVISSNGKHGRTIIICTDRSRIAGNAATSANHADIKRSEIASAAYDLRTARTAIREDRGMTAAQRAQVLAGLDQAQIDIEAAK